MNEAFATTPHNSGKTVGPPAARAAPGAAAETAVPTTTANNTMRLRERGAAPHMTPHIGPCVDEVHGPYEGIDSRDLADRLVLPRLIWLSVHSRATQRWLA